MVNPWPYLQSVARQLMSVSDCDIGLLIRYNCPRALAPLEIILPVNDGPFAQRIALGWSIVGIVSPDLTELDQIGTSHIVLRTQVNNEVIDPNHGIKILECDFQDTNISETKYSQEYCKFLEVRNDNICQCEVPLPLRQDFPSMPDNRSAASDCLKQLERRFSCDLNN